MRRRFREAEDERGVQEDRPAVQRPEDAPDFETAMVDEDSDSEGNGGAGGASDAVLSHRLQAERREKPGSRAGVATASTAAGAVCAADDSSDDESSGSSGDTLDDDDEESGGEDLAAAAGAPGDHPAPLNASLRHLVANFVRSRATLDGSSAAGAAGTRPEAAVAALTELHSQVLWGLGNGGGNENWQRPPAQTEAVAGGAQNAGPAAAGARPTPLAPLAASPPSSFFSNGSLDVSRLICALRIDEKILQKIDHSVKFVDDVYEFRFVVLPRVHPLFDPAALARLAPELAPGAGELGAGGTIAELLNGRLLTEAEWRALGIRQTRGWQHCGTSPHESNVLIFRRALGTDPRTGKVPPRQQRAVAARERMEAERAEMLVRLREREMPHAAAAISGAGGPAGAAGGGLAALSGVAGGGAAGGGAAGGLAGAAGGLAGAAEGGRGDAGVGVSAGTAPGGAGSGAPGGGVGGFIGGFPGGGPRRGSCGSAFGDGPASGGPASGGAAGITITSVPFFASHQLTASAAATELPAAMSPGGPNPLSVAGPASEAARRASPGAVLARLLTGALGRAVGKEDGGRARALRQPRGDALDPDDDVDVPDFLETDPRTREEILAEIDWLTARRHLPLFATAL